MFTVSGRITSRKCHPDFLPMFRDEIASDLLAKAKDLCGADNDACLFDFAATNDKSFAQETKDSNTHMDALINVLSKW